MKTFLLLFRHFHYIILDEEEDVISSLMEFGETAKYNVNNETPFAISHETPVVEKSRKCEESDKERFVPHLLTTIILKTNLRTNKNIANQRWRIL